MKVLAFIEKRNNQLKKNAFEVLTKGLELAKSSDNLALVVMGGNDDDLKQLSEYGAGKAFNISSEGFSDYHVLKYSDGITKAIGDFSPNVVIGAATPMGRDLFPRLAAKNSTAILTDVVEIEENGGKLIGLKPYYAGKCLAKISSKTDKLQFVTIRPNVIEPIKSAGGVSSFTDLAVESNDYSSLVLKEVKAGESNKLDLTESDKIISGGRALASKENFKILEDCAEVLEATVGASRAAVDSGYASHSMQVGQTGKTVNPTLYIACGISGSIQHMAGMRTSKIIVAVNTDEDAPIFSVANYGIVGDLFEVVPKLQEKLKTIR